jgi:glycosyltransferase involved in cell wall biosynthesis
LAVVQPLERSAPTTNEALPLVSVVTVYHNRRNHVADSVESLLAQTYPNLEIIVIDDESTDGTAELLEQIKDPRLKLIWQKNTGFTRAINNAVKASHGTFVAVHGSGDISYPRRIERQASLLMSRPDVGIVGAYVDNEDSLRGGTKLRRPAGSGTLAQRLMGATPFTHGEVMFRRALYDRAGGYREFFRYAQDRDLWLRMSQWTDFAIVEEPLYRRKRLKGAVSDNVDALIMATFLSDFAIQCAKSRDADGRDLIDRYGNYALFFRKRSPALARRLAHDAIRWMLMKKPEGSRKLAEAALGESKTPFVIIAYVATQIPILRDVATTILRPILKSDS